MTAPGNGELARSRSYLVATGCSHDGLELAQAVATKDISALSRASWLSYWTYMWVTPLVRLGRKQPLDIQDVYALPEDMCPPAVLERFNREWADELAHKGPVRASLLWPFFRAYRRDFILTLLEVTVFVFVSIVVCLFSDCRYFVAGRLGDQVQTVDICLFSKY